MFKFITSLLFFMSFGFSKTNTKELQNFMELYLNQVSKGSFSTISHTEDFKSMLSIDKEKYKDCAKTVCKIKWMKPPQVIDMGGVSATRLNIQVLSGKKVISEPNICYFITYKDKKPHIDSFASDCDQ